jgi:conjugative relaxase-like TrwC/TraI family protein
MLLIYEITSAQQAKNYYAGGIVASPLPSRQDYYSEGQEVAGVFSGKLAEELGLAGKPVDKTTFDRLCDNLHPTLNKPLTPRTNSQRRIAYDFTFSAPKSWSMVEAFAPDAIRQQMRQAFRESVQETVARDIEPDMQSRVRAGGADHDITTGNILTAGFDHATARPEHGLPPDPHWHHHLLIFNATKTRDGKIKAGQFGNLYRDSSFYEAAFYSRLAAKCEAMGLPIERQGGKEWEIRGVLPSSIDTFSKRTHRIEAEAKRLGITTDELKGKLGAKTRNHKQKDLPLDKLRPGWMAQLSDPEKQALAKVYAHQVASGPRVTPAEAVSFALAHLSEQQSVFPEREILKVAMLHGLGCVTHDQLVEELPRQGVLVDTIDGRVMATITALQDEERYIVGVAARGRGRADPIGMSAGLERGKLNDGQWETVQSLLNSTNVIDLVEGPFGSGKSTMLKTYDHGLKLAGEKVTYLATTGSAVKVLTKDGFEANTVAHFIRDQAMQQEAAGGILVIDETSLLGHKDTVKLFNLVQKHDLRVVFLGDQAQHVSVARGALMRVLTHHAGITPHRLTEIIRQRDPAYRAAVTLLSQGKTAEGFTAIDRLGWVQELGDDVRHQQIATDYVQARKDGNRWNDLLVISPTHAEGGAITSAIRSQLRDAGMIGQEECEFTRLVATHTSEAERGLATTFKRDDILVFHQNAKGFKRGDQLVVTDPALVPLSEADKFSTYRPEPIQLAKGDILRFTASVKTKDGKHLIRNGTAHAVAGFTSAGSIRLDNDWVVDGDCGFIRHGVCETSYGSQGRTVKHTFVGMSAASSPAINQEQINVSSSRSRDGLTIYTDDKAAIMSAMHRSSQKAAALDLVLAQKPKRIEQNRQRKRRFHYLKRLRAAWPSLARLTGLRRDREASQVTRNGQERQGQDFDHGR